MAVNNLAGIIFANKYDSDVPELTAHRTMGSVPFGGKYRLVDFPLSNMSNSGINNVGLVTKNNFHSLMDHVGTGAAWDLSKRMSGLSLLSPYDYHNFDNRVQALFHLSGYLRHLKEEHLLLTTCDCVKNIDYSKVLSAHLKKKADITIVYKSMEIAEDFSNPMVLSLDENKKVDNIFLGTKHEGLCNLFIGSILIKRDLLVKLVSDCMSVNKLDFRRNILQENINTLNIFGYEFKGRCEFIHSNASYFKANMNLMSAEVRNELFNPERPIYTKVRDDAPSRYGLTSKVKGSLIAQGCKINGEVEGSIISKGVYIAEGAKVKNCIIMQDSKINADCNICNAIIDKDVVITESSELKGHETYPIYISKKTVI